MKEEIGKCKSEIGHLESELEHLMVEKRWRLSIKEFTYGGMGPPINIPLNCPPSLFALLRTIVRTMFWDEEKHTFRILGFKKSLEEIWAKPEKDKKILREQYDAAIDAKEAAIEAAKKRLADMTAESQRSGASGAEEGQ